MYLVFLLYYLSNERITMSANSQVGAPKTKYTMSVRSRKEMKRRTAQQGANNTPGTTKGFWCTATSWDKFCAKYSRAARSQYAQEYYDWCQRKNTVGKK